MPAQVEALSSGVVTPIGAEQPAILPAGDVVLAISGSTGDRLRLDGRPVRGSRLGDRLVVAVDLSRSVGYHHLDLGSGQHHWFGTTDDKLALDGLAAMLSYLREHALTWSGQLIFSNGAVLRDPHVVYGWLDQHAEAVFSAADAIAAAPTWGNTSGSRVSRRGGPSVLVRPTIHLLRRRPSLLEPAEPSRAAMAVAGRTLTPAAIVRRTRRSSLDTVANRRARWMVSAVGSLAAEVMRSDASEPASGRAAIWQARARRMLTHTTVRAIPRDDRAGAAAVAAEELTDHRYRLIWQAARSLTAQLGWSPTTVPAPLYSFVSAMDQVYQAFVGHVIATALGAVRVSSAGSTTFQSTDWDVFIDTVPPPARLRSWRSYSGDPDHYRPDILFVHRASGEVVVGDAKYRSEGPRAAESARKEIAAYMSSYGLKTALILYPPASGELVMSRVASHGMAIYEIGIVPAPALSEFASAAMSELLESVAEVPPWAG